MENNTQSPKILDGFQEDEHDAFQFLKLTFIKNEFL